MIFIDDTRVRHRDWYIDEGPVDPISGAVAAASSVATNSLSLAVDYTRGFSKSIHKKPTPKDEDTTSSDSATYPSLEYSPSWDIAPPRNPVQAAAHFPQERIEAVAYKIAAKALPNPAQQKPKRYNSSGLVKRSSTLRPSSSMKVTEEHGRVHDAAHETGHFATSMVKTGLRGKQFIQYHGFRYG
jgi:hypothetical protein